MAEIIPFPNQRCSHDQDCERLRLECGCCWRCCKSARGCDAVHLEGLRMVMLGMLE